VFVSLQLDQIKLGIEELRSKIVYEYVEQLSAFTMMALFAVFSGLAFTFYKVNKMTSKAHHMF